MDAMFDISSMQCDPFVFKSWDRNVIVEAYFHHVSTNVVTNFSYFSLSEKQTNLFSGCDVFDVAACIELFISFGNSKELRNGSNSSKFFPESSPLFDSIILVEV